MPDTNYQKWAIYELYRLGRIDWQGYVELLKTVGDPDAADQA